MRTVYVIMILPEVEKETARVFAGVCAEREIARESVRISYSRMPERITFVPNATGNDEIRYGNRVVGEILIETLRDRPDHL